MKLKNIYKSALALSALTLLAGSCNLDREPIDSYGSGNFWKTEAQASAFVDGMHATLRSHYFTHTFVLGEARGGNLRQSDVGADGRTLAYGLLIYNNLTEDQPQLSNYSNYYGALTNINLFIARMENGGDYVPEAKRKYLLGQAYGLRAFYYFDLFRTFGAVPVRLTADVVEGVLDPLKLFAKESKATEVVAQIKGDITKSLELFGNVTSFDPYSKNNRKAQWSKAATEMLAAEFYLWTAKVSTGDQVADEANLATAKTHLESVMNGYGLGLMDSFADVFESRNNKGNKEVIFAIRFAEGEATNANNDFLYSMTAGFTKNDFLADGTPFGDALGIKNTGGQIYEYRSGLYDMYEAGDTRRDATFLASYKKKDDGTLYRYGTHVRKNIGYVNAQGVQVYCGDYVIYRLPEVYLMLAEIANMQGDNANVVKYINLVRKRAYGSAYVEATHGYTAGDFTANELAILHEKDKEFVQEGQRWYDLRRMTLTKGGKHLVFAIEAAIPDGDLTTKPVLDEATEAHEVLWPLDKNLLNKEKDLYQTPGYTTSKPRKNN